jgi:hypothetical protein
MSADLMEPEADERWPLRPVPYPGELFSSWLVRVARCYELPVQTFCWNVWPGREAWRGDVDRQIDDETLHFLSRKTGVRFSELLSMTLRESQAPLFQGQLKKTFSTQYCPLCLSQHAYFKKVWRLAGVSECARHVVPLQNDCGGCGAYCQFLKVPPMLPLDSCYRCQALLRSLHRSDSVRVRGAVNGLLLAAISGLLRKAI